MPNVQVSADDITVRYGRGEAGPKQKAAVSQLRSDTFVATLDSQDKVGRIRYSIQAYPNGSDPLLALGDLVVTPYVEDLGNLIAVRYGATKVLKEDLGSYLTKEAAQQAFTKGAETASSKLLMRLGLTETSSASAATLVGKLLGLGVGVIGFSPAGNPGTGVEAYVTTQDDGELKEQATVTPGEDVYPVFVVTLGVETVDHVQIGLKSMGSETGYEPVWRFDKGYGDWRGKLGGQIQRTSFHVKEPIPSDRLTVGEDGRTRYKLKTTIPDVLGNSDIVEILVRVLSPESQ